ncbi:hypothetical protein AAG906_022400 [Vitis piasezkii]
MEEKVLTMESQAEALGQLTSDELDGKFALLESSSVDDDLANLKKELSGSSKKGELPPGRASVSSTSMALPFQDTEDFTTLEPTDAVGPSNRSVVAGNAAMMIWQSSATRAASNLTNTFLPNEIKDKNSS